MRVVCNLNIEMSDESVAYLDTCARIRQISTSRLIQHVVKVICDDQLVLSVLDDDSRPTPLMPGEQRRYRTKWKRAA